MTVETEQEIAALKRIGRIVAQTLSEMQNHLRPGMTTAELDDVGARFLQKHGAQSAPQLAYDFPAATCISINDQAAHGIPGNRVVRAGDLVNIDVSAELDGYFADTGASIPVPPVSPRKQKLCQYTKSALKRALSAARAGKRINEIGWAIEKEAQRGRFQTIRNLGGHGIGRSIHEQPHDIPSYYNRRDSRRLQEGMVLAIEPFLSTGARYVTEEPDGWTLTTPDGSVTAQYEHTVIVTRGAPIMLTVS